ncbi:hypothetical protein BADSM9389_20220 [Buttiauxella agrestis]|nr:hypothetical protein BADSM9389_20220 [Buttiauxella agrestis]
MTAAFRRNLRHHKNQAHKQTCVMMPHGWVTVSVTQYIIFSQAPCAPGTHCQPEIHTASGMINSIPAPIVVRFAIARITFPYAI